MHTTYTEVDQYVTTLLQGDSDREPTQEQLDMWKVAAEINYRDVDRCDNSDLRSAFYLGVRIAYEVAVVINPPRNYDRLQADAFFDGVKLGESEADQHTYSRSLTGGIRV
jgi:hypothetical protein